MQCQSVQHAGPALPRLHHHNSGHRQEQHTGQASGNWRWEDPLGHSTNCSSEQCAEEDCGRRFRLHPTLSDEDSEPCGSGDPERERRGGCRHPDRNTHQLAQRRCLEEPSTDAGESCDESRSGGCDETGADALGGVGNGAIGELVAPAERPGPLAVGLGAERRARFVPDTASGESGNGTYDGRPCEHGCEQLLRDRDREQGTDHRGGRSGELDREAEPVVDETGSQLPGRSSERCAADCDEPEWRGRRGVDSESHERRDE